MPLAIKVPFRSLLIRNLSTYKMLVILSFVAIVVSAQAVLALPIPAGKKTAGFAANPKIDAKAIFAAAKKGKSSLAKFPPRPEVSSKVDIFGDWVNLIPGNPIFQFIADMDVDCDGGDVSPDPRVSINIADAPVLQFKCKVRALPFCGSVFELDSG